jgi:hypothetical protein
LSSTKGGSMFALQMVIVVVCLIVIAVNLEEAMRDV